MCFNLPHKIKKAKIIVKKKHNPNEGEGKGLLAKEFERWNLQQRSDVHQDSSQSLTNPSHQVHATT